MSDQQVWSGLLGVMALILPMLLIFGFVLIMACLRFIDQWHKDRLEYKLQLARIQAGRASNKREIPSPGAPVEIEVKSDGE